MPEARRLEPINHQNNARRSGQTNEQWRSWELSGVGKRLNSRIMFAHIFWSRDVKACSYHVEQNEDCAEEG